MSTRHRLLSALLFSRRAQPMPQLTLFADPASKSLSLSPEKAKTARSSSSRAAAYTKREAEPNLWELHHHQEDMAAASKSRVKAKVEEVEEDNEHTKGDRAKGHPGKRRAESPEGGGVAGKEAKRHKNAYEISE
jgi:hypothetical protein